jgi:hypothetical protein
MSPTPLVFVHIGDRFPRYARASVRNAASLSGLPVMLLTNATRGIDRLPGVTVHDLDWYDSGLFKVFRERSGLPSDFRDGFWFHAAERFFILAQAMRHFGFSSIVHAENDVHVFNVSSVPGLLNRLGAGLFVPQPYDGFVIASFVYLNDVAALERFCQYAVGAPQSSNEMQLLADFSAEDHESVTFLPTDMSLAGATAGRFTNRLATVEELGGIVDANAMGQWLLGRDPRNQVGPVHNRFQNPNAPHDLAQFGFSISSEPFELFAHGPVGSARVLALHGHSKSNRRLRNARLLRRVVRRNAQGRSTRLYAGITPSRHGGTLLPSRMTGPLRRRRFRWI